jgi:ribosomal protein S14
MFLKKALHRDLKLRLVFEKYEKELLLLKFLFKNEYLDPELRLLAYNLYLQRPLVRTQINNLCLVTARSRGTIKEYKISRIVFHKYYKLGFLPGVIKN